MHLVGFTIGILDEVVFLCWKFVIENILLFNEYMTFHPNKMSYHKTRIGSAACMRHWKQYPENLVISHPLPRSGLNGCVNAICSNRKLQGRK